MKYPLVTASLFVIGSATCSLANEVTVEITPTAQPVSGFPEEMKPDVSGVAIGMTVEDVRNVFSKNPNINDIMSNLPLDTKVGNVAGSGYETNEQIMEFSAEEGNFRVQFSPTITSASTSAANVIIKPPYGAKKERTGEFVSAAFGSGFTGGHVQIIKSARVFNEPIDTEALKSAVIDKYGEPHLIKDSKYNTVFYYAYVDGSATHDKGVAEFCTSDNFSSKLFMLMPDSGIYRFNSASHFFFNARPFPPSEKCDAGIAVNMKYGDLKSVVQSVSIDMIDHVAIEQDITEFNRVSGEELEKLKAGYQGTTEVPKL